MNQKKEAATEIKEKAGAANALSEARECLAMTLLPHDPDAFLDTQMATAYALIAIAERLDRIIGQLRKNWRL